MSKRSADEMKRSSDQYEHVFKKIGNKVAVIGIGKLGLCFALSIEKLGYDVVGVDVSPVYVDALNAKKYNSKEPDVENFLTASKNFRATTDLSSALDHADVVFILVATPTVGGRHMYDHTTLGTLLTKVNRLKVSNKHFVISSTVMPGYIRKIARPLLRDCTNVTVSYNPAFVAQGEVMKGYRTGGFFGLVLTGADNDTVYEYLAYMYHRLAETADTSVHVAKMSPESAEVAKISSNCFRTLKIAYANMIGDICDATPGADKHEVCAALMNDDSIGPKCMRPGYGFGGPCYPRDNIALALYADSVGVDATLSKASNSSNAWHAKHMATKLLAENRDAYEFSQVAYKPNCPVPMIEESQKLVVAELVARSGKPVTIVDVPEVLDMVRQEFGVLFQYREDQACKFNPTLDSDKVHY
mmetsp:Transcript_28640/g.56270  ORF Transcript_28640/g.56270 Transcript_28640/m.56270 type:complete len:414 (+) Transcript_28640:35-1276(+)|eukprot:CAMPEP_0175155262 /NCGR_PEP_ID=MMETSP0087-20121206/20870_1 /TAXON_ID=136419 /ORGANISM="Unknown Unknown, Strain D1" /LENGTH=413 /DNA_ID=CAMNT_0016442383 /DNA_START=22 /DNA_END=1263 /DNA_ORIENTATION=+